MTHLLRCKKYNEIIGSPLMYDSIIKQYIERNYAASIQKKFNILV